MADARLSATGAIGLERSTKSTSEHRAGWLVAAVYALACVPLLLASAPPLLDYPNHLARIWLEAGGAAHPPLSQIYAIDWSQAVTNVGLDWLASGLGHVLPFAALDRVLRLAMFLSAPLGAVMLARALFGRVGLWHLAPVMLVWSETTLLGFLNYSAAIGAALWCAAALPGLHRRIGGWTLAAHFAFAGALFLIHPFGLLFYLAVVTGLILGPDFGMVAAHEWRSIAARLTAALLPCVAVAALVMAQADSAPDVSGMSGFDFSPGAMAATLLSPFTGYSAALDLLLCLPVLAYLIAGFASGRVAVHRGLVAVALLLVPLALSAPLNIGDASMVNRRLPMMIALLLAAGLFPQPRLPRGSWALPALLLVAVLARIGWTTQIWLARDADAADLFAVTRSIPPGSAVMVARYAYADPAKAPTGRVLSDGGYDLRRQLPALLVERNRAFIPTLFAVPGQQPLRVLPPRDRDSEESSLIPKVAQLWSGGDDRYLSRWRCDFDYLLLIDTDVPGRARFDASGLYPVATSRFAELFRIERPAPGAPCGPPDSDAD